jgi:hypothetical protein
MHDDRLPVVEYGTTTALLQHLRVGGFDKSSLGAV